MFKIPPLTDTHACSRLRKSFMALLGLPPARRTKSVAVYLKTREIFLAVTAACDKTPELPQT